VFDLASSTPTVLPDGGVLFGALDNYNYGRGHMFKVNASGSVVGIYSFGWDSTPAVYLHDGTYSIVIKDNHYASPAYCFDPNNPVCSSISAGPFYITQLDPNLNVEWQFQSTTIDVDHPNGRVVRECSGDRCKRCCVCEQRGWERLCAAAGKSRGIHDSEAKDVFEAGDGGGVYAAIDWAGWKAVCAECGASVCGGGLRGRGFKVSEFQGFKEEAVLHRQRRGK
jgi:hypothetical protein